MAAVIHNMFIHLLEGDRQSTILACKTYRWDILLLRTVGTDTRGDKIGLDGHETCQGSAASTVSAPAKFGSNPWMELRSVTNSKHESTMGIAQMVLFNSANGWAQVIVDMLFIAQR